MPYREGIQSHGEDYVGELHGLRQKLLKTLGNYKINERFSEEAELIEKSDRLDQDHVNQKNKHYDRMAYVFYWAGRKAEDRIKHSKRRCWSDCPSCGLCECGRAIGTERFRCMCNEGKKMLSPTRIVFINSLIREEWRTKIWEVGIGWVPRSRQETKSPEWQKLKW